MKQLDIGKLEEIKKRWDLATPGPWRRGNSFDIFVDSEGAKKGKPGSHIADCDPVCSKPFEQGRADAMALHQPLQILPGLFRP